MTDRLYLDHAATGVVHPAAAAAMAPWWGASVGNAASAHAEGRAAASALATARERVAALVGARPEEVVFTSGATEATNLAVRGGAHIRRNSGKHVASTRIEHPATRACCDQLAVDGWDVVLWTVDDRGRVDPARAMLPHGTSVVSVIAGHNELGTLQPLHELAAIAHRVGAFFHLDAVQTAAYVDLSAVDWDLLSLSAHKLGGPQGVGALVRRDRPALTPVVVGSSQEFGLRPGTVPIALAAGFGAAAEVALAHRAAEARRLAQLRDQLGSALIARVAGAVDLGTWRADPGFALPHILPLGIPGLAGDEIVHALDQRGVAASSSSACLSGARSATLDAIALPAETALLRLSLGWTTRSADVARAMAVVPEAIADLRAMSAFERRRGPFAQRAGRFVALTAAHWEAAEAVFGYYQAEGVLPGARTLAKLGAAGRVGELFPKGLPTLAHWLGLPVPRGGCRPYAG
jgi:cysteine desulfurase